MLRPQGTLWVVYQMEVFKLGNFSQKRNYSNTNRDYLYLTRNKIIFYISNFTISFMTHCLKIIMTRFKDILVILGGFEVLSPTTDICIYIYITL